MDSPITLSRTIRAAPEAAYRAFTTPLGLQDWCADAAGLDARPGGHIFIWTEAGYRMVGLVTRLDENECVEWETQTPGNGLISIRIKPAEGGSRVSLTFQAGADLEAQTAFWDPALDNLKAVLETGLDRRVYDRPMLGVLIGGMLDAETRSKYRTPVPYGVILSGAIPGMGAAELGLAEADILIELGESPSEVPLENYNAFKEALEGKKAGDRIRVVWYRGGERMEGRLRLVGRPEPFIPATPAELAEYTGAIYDRLDAELAEILDDVTEEEGDFSPDEKEWSVKEIIAHTIATERGAQAWIAAALEGEALKDVASNAHSLVKSIVYVHPTLPALAAELHKTEKQTVAMVRRLPPEIVAHKGIYTNIVTTLGEHGLAVHTRMHYETIRAQLEVVRSLKKQEK